MAKNYSSVSAKYVEREFVSKTTTMIMEDSVGIIYWRNSPLVVYIRSKDIAKDYLSEFLRLWKQAN